MDESGVSIEDGPIKVSAWKHKNLKPFYKHEEESFLIQKDLVTTWST